MLRHGVAALRDPLRFLRWCQAEYGDVVAFPVPGRPVLLVSDPVAVRRLLQVNHRAYGKRTVQYDTLSLVTGDGLLTSDGETWRAHRRLIQPAFHRSALRGVGDACAAAAARLCSEWDALPGGSIVDVDAAMMRASLEVVGQALFAADLTRDSARLTRAVGAALDVVVRRARSPISAPAGVPTTGNLRLRHALHTIDDAVGALVTGRQREPPRADLLGLLLAGDGTGRPLPDKQVRDEIVTQIVAGHETVATSLTWTWHLLGHHPAAAQCLHAEAVNVLAGRAASIDDLPELTWTRKVVDESLRLFPPAWLVTRRALEADVLAGYRVEPGTLVIVSPYVMHRHPTWWDDPDAFRPERFATPRVAHPAYLPFGAGPRLCIGRDFALVEATLLLATLAQRFALCPLPGAPVRMDALVTIRPRGGLPMRLVRRVG
jgi:cytochrome P450